MESKRVALAILALTCLCGLVFGLGGCAKEKANEGEGLAKVGSKVITESELQKRLSELPPYMQQQLSTADGKKRLLDGLIEEELMYKDALAAGLDKTDEYKNDMAQSSRDILLRMYYEKMVEGKAKPTDKEISDYFDAHKSDFVMPENLTVRHILVKTREEALSIRNQLDHGASFADLAAKYSLDASSKSSGGLVGGPVQKNGNVKGLGMLPEFAQAAFALKEGEVSQPVKTARGYHLILLEKRNPETQRTLDQAKNDIITKMSNAKLRETRDNTMAQLRAKYKVVYLNETKAQAETPEDLFKMAGEASTPQDKIKYYQEFVDKFPTNERAYEAKFMAGFTMAEELKDYDGAEKIFKDFLEKYPSTDLSDDAKWMIENMRSGKHPDLKGN
ncbi:MAG TPA: peptidyl-prolyl cis-trans isomerase [bacterium]|nr:peptidyl-prolyl cis-trans isomerase [bacterium]